MAMESSATGTMRLSGHNLAGTKATGPVTADDAVDAGDIGIAMSEYQAVGLDSVSDDVKERWRNRYTCSVAEIGVEE